MATNTLAGVSLFTEQVKDGSQLHAKFHFQLNKNIRHTQTLVFLILWNSDWQWKMLLAAHARNDIDFWMVVERSSHSWGDLWIGAATSLPHPSKHQMLENVDQWSDAQKTGHQGPLIVTPWYNFCLFFNFRATAKVYLLLTESESWALKTSPRQWPSMARTWLAPTTPIRIPSWWAQL